MKFFIGTTNLNKAQEIVSILAAADCEFEITPPVNPDETEPDFEGNAILKARVYAQHVDGITISEDSGIIIPALGGLPGPWSARFSECIIDKSTWTVTGHAPLAIEREERDRRNNQLVLDLLADVEEPNRIAMLKLVLVVAQPDGTVLFKAEAESHGTIAPEMCGKYGFGYDPIFVGIDTFGKTYAQLDPMRKNLRSHRGKVLSEFKVWLHQYKRDAL